MAAAHFICRVFMRKSGRLPKACLILLLSFGLLSFLLPTEQGHNSVANCYDAKLDTLMESTAAFEAAAQTCNSEEAREYYRRCRNGYKSFGFLLQYLDTRNARLLNGPDLLRIEEEAPSDSIKPHGFQVIERCIYAGEAIDRATLEDELMRMAETLHSLRNEPSRIYQFTAPRVFNALRTGVYGIIALDASGFDAPLSKESIGGAVATLKGMREIFQLYPANIYRKKPWLYAGTIAAFDKCIHYLEQPHSFNNLDRMLLCRNYLNPLSSRLTACANGAGLIDKEERSALNMEAENLFSKGIFNPLFFAPNNQYRPTPARIALGKKLFYEPRLSGNGLRSCGSCHQPAKAFADGLLKPTRIGGEGTLLRNTPTLLNSSLQTRQFYDMRTDKLENQLSDVVHNADEMGGSLSAAAQWLMQDRQYSGKFKIAYPSLKGNIDAYQIANAISSYVRSLISLNAPFDQYMRGEIQDYPTAAIRGFNLFMGKAACGTCHYAPVFNGLVPPLYNDTEAEVLGVPETKGNSSKIDPDAGRMRFTRLALHRYAFKTPTVRNAALTAPYMHNGVFPTLKSVIAFYNDGGGRGRGIFLDNQTLPQTKLELTKQEQSDIIAFIKTLTDTSAAR